MMKIAVYLGSRDGGEVFQQAAKQLGTALASKGYDIIYGGACVGTMGIMADAALGAGGRVVGVYPKAFKGKKENHHREVFHRGLSETIDVEDMSHRKKVMENMSDACIIMPGSYGTFDEFFEYVVNRQLGFHSKQIYVLNVAGYYDPLKAMVDNMVAGGFISPEERGLFSFYDTVEELISAIH